jgi:hypothetical protein
VVERREGIGEKEREFGESDVRRPKCRPWRDSSLRGGASRGAGREERQVATPF